jgi:hypothetical protein
MIEAVEASSSNRFFPSLIIQWSSYTRFTLEDSSLQDQIPKKTWQMRDPKEDIVCNTVKINKRVANLKTKNFNKS